MHETGNDSHRDDPGGLEELCDRDLIRRFATRRDEEAFRLMVERHGGLVFGVCRRILRRHQDAEDAFQATFLVLAEKAGSIRKRESLANWLYGTACRIALNAGTRLQRRQEQRMEQEPTVSGCFEAVAAHEAAYALHEELNRLPEQYRAPLVLCYLQGKTRDEAAKELGVSTNAVKGRLERGRHQLRVRLLRRGINITLPTATGAATLPTGAAEAPSSLGPAPNVVPDSLVTSTVQAATTFATAGSLGGAVSAQALSLAKGELAMFSSTFSAKQLVTAAVVLTALGVSCLWFSVDASAQSVETAAPVDTRYSGNAVSEAELPPGLLAMAVNVESGDGNAPAQDGQAQEVLPASAARPAERFLREAPRAWQEYQSRLQEIEGAVQFQSTNEKTDEVTLACKLRFKRKGNWLVRIDDYSAGPNAGTRLAVGRNSDYAFSLEDTGNDDWVVTWLNQQSPDSPVPSRGGPVGEWVRHFFCRQGYVGDFEPLKALQENRLQVQHVGQRQIEDGSLVEVEFDYRPEENAQLLIQGGTLAFDPENYWLLVEGKLRVRYRVPDYGTYSVKAEYEHTDNGVPLLKHLERHYRGWSADDPTQTGNRSRPPDIIRNAVWECDLKLLESVDESQFRLSALGLSEPGEDPSSLWRGLLVAGGLVALGILILATVAVRRSHRKHAEAE